MMTTQTVLRTDGFIKAKNPNWLSQFVSGSEKPSEAKAAFRKPASVMAIWMADRNPLGEEIILSIRTANLSPSSAWARSLFSSRLTSANSE